MRMKRTIPVQKLVDQHRYPEGHRRDLALCMWQNEAKAVSWPLIITPKIGDTLASFVSVRLAHWSPICLFFFTAFSAEHPVRCLPLP
jgi:hypothetical protein